MTFEKNISPMDVSVCKGHLQSNNTTILLHSGMSRGSNAFAIFLQIIIFTGGGKHLHQVYRLAVHRFQYLNKLDRNLCLGIQYGRKVMKS